MVNFYPVSILDKSIAHWMVWSLTLFALSIMWNKINFVIWYWPVWFENTFVNSCIISVESKILTTSIAKIGATNKTVQVRPSSLGKHAGLIQQFHTTIIPLEWVIIFAILLWTISPDPHHEWLLMTNCLDVDDDVVFRAVCSSTATTDLSTNNDHYIHMKVHHTEHHTQAHYLNLQICGTRHYVCLYYLNRQKKQKWWWDEKCYYHQ